MSIGENGTALSSPVFTGTAREGTTGRFSIVAMRATTVAAVALMAHVTSAAADPIPGLFDTGVADDGSVLPDGSPELHYILTSQPNGSDCSVSVVGNQHGFPIGPWLRDHVTHFAWISPCAGQTIAAGYYAYRLTFDLTGFDPATAGIEGRWAADNAARIFVNGTELKPSTSTFLSLSHFSLHRGFVPGVNTLDFVVLNYNDTVNPSGLIVKIRGAAAPLNN